MKRRLFLLVPSIVLLAGPALRADDPDDTYVNFYIVLKEADKVSTNGSPQEAKLRYQQAEVALRNLEKNHPDYNRQLIQYREAYLERRLEQLSASNNVAPAKAAPAPAQPPAESQPAANPPKQQK